MTRDIDEVEKKLAESLDESLWILRPTPIPSLSSPAKREAFKKAVADARVQLIHEDWDTVSTAVRELSDAGGIELVEVYRVVTRTKVTRHFDWRDGKQLKTRGGQS